MTIISYKYKLLKKLASPLATNFTEDLIIMMSISLIFWIVMVFGLEWMLRKEVLNQLKSLVYKHNWSDLRNKLRYLVIL